ncbi:hypothetical protein M5K25_013609 [Dendrobium thyrsiflorum]|uniref:Uncharacterized protein n=1 Tax=Dendrobium thyrsiflorum TaxID=117978 RepID=A0ABD0UU71_DENTH
MTNCIYVNIVNKSHGVLISCMCRRLASYAYLSLMEMLLRFAEVASLKLPQGDNYENLEKYLIPSLECLTCICGSKYINNDPAAFFAFIYYISCDDWSVYIDCTLELHGGKSKSGLLKSVL